MKHVCVHSFLKRMSIGSGFQPGLGGMAGWVRKEGIEERKRGLVLLYLCDNTALLTFPVLVPSTRAVPRVPKFVPLKSNRAEHSLLQGLLSAPEKTAFLHFLRGLLLHPYHTSEHACAISVLA